MNHKGVSIKRGWDWIIAAEETSAMLSLLVKALPRFEIYLAKAKLNQAQFRVLRSWFVARGKLPATGTE